MASTPNAPTNMSFLTTRRKFFEATRSPGVGVVRPVSVFPTVIGTGAPPPSLVWASGTISLNLTSGVPFSLDLDMYCTGAVSYQVVSGSLPTGLALSGSKNNIVSGTPTVSGTFNVTFQASDTTAFTLDLSANENPIVMGGQVQRGGSDGGVWLNPKTYTAANGDHVICADIQSGTTPPNFERYNDSIFHIKTSARTFTQNQYVVSQVYRAPGYTLSGSAKHEVEALLRFSISSNVARGYETMWGIDGNTGLGYIATVRWNGPGGSYDDLFFTGYGGAPQPQLGDWLYTEIIGNIIKIRTGSSAAGAITGTLRGTVDISSIGGTIWTSGQPGGGFWPVDGATPQSLGWKAWMADNLP